MFIMSLSLFLEGSALTLWGAGIERVGADCQGSKVS